MNRIEKSRWVLPRPRLLWRYMTDPEVALWRRLLMLLVPIYIVLPVDLVSDFIPFWGWLDDIGVLGMAVLYLSRQLSRYPKSKDTTP